MRMNKNYDNRKLDFQNSIEFKNISFSYDNKNITYIRRQWVRKSTLVNLLMGLIKPTNGVITLMKKTYF